MLRKIRNALARFSGRDGAKKTGGIVSFGTVTLRTMGMRQTAETEIVMKDGGAEISRYVIRFSQNEDRRELTARALCGEDEALALFNACRLLSWDGFAGSQPKGVLDGTMFSLTAVVNGGKKITAHGSQNFPKHYREFTDGLEKLLSGDGTGED